MVGPSIDSLEIIEFLALPPRGDGDLVTPGATDTMPAPLSEAMLLVVARRKLDGRMQGGKS